MKADKGYEEKAKEYLANSETSILENKSLFRSWITSKRFNMLDPEEIVQVWDKISDKLVYSEMSPLSLWEISDANTFRDIYFKVKKNLFFMIAERKAYYPFVEIGKYYLRFLESKQAIRKDSEINQKPTPVHFVKQTEKLTIKEAVIHVLEIEKIAMTVEQIYNSIVERKLYSFGAQNPVSVLLIEIERSCEKSNYSKRTSEVVFGYKIGDDEEKLYYLLDAAQFDNQLKSVQTGNQKTLEPSLTSPVEENRVFATNVVSFNRPDLITNTRPISCMIEGDEIVLDKHNWVRLLVAVTEFFIAKKNPYIDSLNYLPICSEGAFFKPTQTGIGNSILLSNGKWIYTKYNAQTIVKIIENLLLHCKVNLNDVVITYGVKDDLDVFLPNQSTHEKGKHSYSSEQDNESKFYAQYVTTSEMIEKAESIRVAENQNHLKTYIVNFNRLDLIARTRPISCIIGGEEIISNKHNWARLLVTITEFLIAKKNPYLDTLHYLPICRNKSFFMTSQSEAGSSTLLSNGKWIYTNYSSQSIVKIIENLLLHCKIFLGDVVITYVAKDDVSLPYSSNSIKQECTDETAIKSSNSEVIQRLNDIFKKVLETHFSNGLRVDSSIELIRFRRYAKENFDTDISLSDEELKLVIFRNGTLFEGKIYLISQETLENIKRTINDAIFNGVKIIFYESFFNKHESWLLEGKVCSAAMMKDIVTKLYPSLIHKSNYCVQEVENTTELLNIKSEILRVWSSDYILSFEQISERLPYIPMDKIKYALSYDTDFVWSTTGSYTLLIKIDVTDEERITISGFVEDECKAKGYATFAKMPIEEVKERNSDLSLTAIQNAVFQSILVDKFVKRGKIIMLKDANIDAISIMKDYCSALDRCSLQSLIDYERELTGEAHRWIPMEAAYSVMIRADEDTYIAEKYVHFEVDGIDNVLDMFIQGDYLPLKSIKTFAVFPHCGLLWNSYVLESYCRRFSKRFRFEVLAVNLKSVGAIVRKNCPLSYHQLMTDAVAKSDVMLNSVSVVDFLFSNGYIGKRSYSKINDLISHAKVIREKRV